MIRNLLAGAAFAAGLAAAPALTAAPADYHFRVLLDGKPIGHHRFQFEERPGGYRLVSEADYQVDFLFFTAYEYEHRSEERWRDGCLVRIDSRTDDNGETWRIQGEGTDSGYSLKVNGEAGEVARDCLRTFAYWRPSLLEAEALLNSQNGELESVTLSEAVSRPLPWDGGGEATRYRLETAQRPIELWYGDDGRWLALRSELENGRILTYRPAASTGDSP